MPYPQYGYFAKTTECKEQPIAFPPQKQQIQPGLEYVMNPRPIYENPDYKGSGKLRNKAAFITGGDSGIGRAAAVAFAKEGADIAFTFLNEHIDAAETCRRIEELGRRCVPIAIDMRSKAACTDAVQRAVSELGGLNVVVNNQAVQFPQNQVLDISEEELEVTFRTNVYSYFFVTQAAVPYLKDGDSIINTSSIAAHSGHKQIIAYSASKGAVESFTRSLAHALVEKGIRVNAVAPGPVWTPLIAATFPVDMLMRFGTWTPMQRAAQPFELAPMYVYLATDDSRYVTGQTMHVDNGNFIQT